MPVLKPIKVNTRRGRRLLESLEGRGDLAIDRRTVRRVEKILRSVRRGGDFALLRAVAQYDGVEEDEVRALRLDRRRDVESLRPRDLPPGFQNAFERAVSSIEHYHREGHHQGYVLEADGKHVEERVEAFERVALYVPGGRFLYPSTVAMSVIPARIAGVREIVVVTPPRAFLESPALRWALSRLEVDEIWGMGGAHGIAAVAYGTETIDPVDFIAGPGGVWVTAAKEQVKGVVGIDRFAGPSEVVIVASADAPCGFVAADLLAQAEHDPEAMAVLVTPDRDLAGRVAREVDRQLEGLPTAETAALALQTRGAILLTKDLEQAAAIAERLAPEHLQLLGLDAVELAPQMRSAGAVFVGPSAPVVLGDYVAGPSHVLPTGGTARYASGLGVGDFKRRWHVVRFDENEVVPWAAAAATLARVEGLEAHARSALLRSGGLDADELEDELSAHTDLLDRE